MNILAAMEHPQLFSPHFARPTWAAALTLIKCCG